MPKTHVSKSVNISASAEKVFSIISDLSQWEAWSPWSIMEPEVKIKVADDNKFYEWEGNRTGSGNMKITSENPNETISMDLNFIKPWKSYADIKFELKESEGSTEVIWSMDSSLPFFMFFMKKMMEGFIGMDFERGLKMLKEYVEDNKVQSKLEFVGNKKFEGVKYIGIKSTAAMNELGIRMSADFKKLEEYMNDNKSNVIGPVFSQYHKWDIVKQQTQYTSGMGVMEIPANLPSDFVAGEIPATKVYTLRHVGKYDHLGNAWSTLNSMYRNKEFKNNKKIHPFEIYVSDPSEVAPENLVTDVNFAIK